MRVGSEELELLFSRAQAAQRRAAALVALSPACRDLWEAHMRLAGDGFTCVVGTAAGRVGSIMGGMDEMDGDGTGWHSSAAC